MKLSAKYPYIVRETSIGRESGFEGKRNAVFFAKGFSFGTYEVRILKKGRYELDSTYRYGKKL